MNSRVIRLDQAAPPTKKTWANYAIWAACALLMLASPRGKAGETNTVADSIAPALYTSMDALDNEYKLGPGDRVSYRVAEDREETRALTVNAFGELDVPYLGRVKVRDKTCKALATELKATLEKELYRKATVLLATDESNRKLRFNVLVLGRVRRAGPLEMSESQSLTISQAILLAGGFSDFANQKKVRLTRPPKDGQNKPEIRVIDVRSIFEKSRLEDDIMLEPGDRILVPSRAINF